MPLDGTDFNKTDNAPGLSPENLARFHRLLSWLDNGGDGVRLDMRSILATTSCGTSACMLGYLMLDSNHWDMHRSPSPCDLGMSRMDFHKLFFADVTHRPHDAVYHADRVRTWLRTGVAPTENRLSGATINLLTNG